MRFGNTSLIRIKWHDARKEKPKKTCFVFLKFYDERFVTPYELDSHCVDPSHIRGPSSIVIYDKNARLFNGTISHPESAFTNVYEWAEVPDELCPGKLSIGTNTQSRRTYANAKERSQRLYLIVALYNRR